MPPSVFQRLSGQVSEAQDDTSCAVPCFHGALMLQVIALITLSVCSEFNQHSTLPLLGFRLTSFRKHEQSGCETHARYMHAQRLRVRVKGKYGINSINIHRLIEFEK